MKHTPTPFLSATIVLAITVNTLLGPAARAAVTTVTTLPATGLTATSATLNGTVNPDNLPTTAWFQYGLTTDYGNIGSLYSLPATNSTLALASVVSSISGLAGTNWTARDSNRNWTAVASSADGTKLVAAVRNGQLYTSTDSGVTWTARDSSRGWHSVASAADGTKLVAGFLWGQLYTSTDSGVTWTARDSSRYWSYVASSADGTKLVAGAYSGQLYTSTGDTSNLTPGTTYHYQLVGINSAGTTLGADQTFTTPLLKVITVSVPPNGGGTVSGNGTFTAGSSRTLTATANSGYSFATWTENGIVVSTNATFTFELGGNRDLVAHFTKNLPVSLFRVGLNFAKPGRDTAALTASITVSNLLALGGQPLTLKLGDAAITFTFRANGKTLTATSKSLSGPNGGGALTIKPKGSTTGILKFGGLTKGNWQADLAKLGLTNTTIPKPGVSVTVPVTIEVGGEVYAARVQTLYTAKAGKTGLAKK